MNEHADTTAGPGHEPASVSSRLLLLSAAGLALLIAVSLLGVWGYQQLLGGGSAAGSQAEEEAVVDTPLEPYQRRQRVLYERRQYELLHDYGWNEGRPRTARIPIERAMKLVAKRYASKEKKKSDAKKESDVKKKADSK